MPWVMLALLAWKCKSQSETPAGLFHCCLVIQWWFSKCPFRIVLLVDEVITCTMAAIHGFALQAILMLLFDCAAVHVFHGCITCRFHCDFLLFVFCFTIPLFLRVKINFAFPIVGHSFPELTSNFGHLSSFLPLQIFCP